MKRLLAVLATGLLIGACGPSPQNDPIYQALLANPPTEVPAELVSDVRNGKSRCKVFNENQNNQYMLCFFAVRTRTPPNSATTTRPAATVGYYGPNPINPPEPSQIVSRGGAPLNAILL